jgi:copper resistance protein C
MELKIMFNKIALISSFLFFLLATNVFAHSHLENSTPSNGEVLTQALKDISLSFETDLEPTSTFTLVDATGTALPLSPITINGSELVGTLEEDLPNGAYSIHWKIIGTDGHQLEGDIPFTVQLPESTATTKQDVTVVSSVENSQNKTTEAPEEVMKEQAALPDKVESNEPSLKAYIVPVSIGLILILGFGSYWLIFRRKQV